MSTERYRRMRRGRRGGGHGTAREGNRRGGRRGDDARIHRRPGRASHGGSEARDAVADGAEPG